MIKVKNLVPEVYYDHSRDFQLIGRLYEIVFNYLKTNSDTIYDIPSAASINSEELELLATTLGFQSKHNYPVNQLRAICGSLSEILKNKGTLKSIEQALNALLRAEDITDIPTVFKDRDDDGNYLQNISIYIPSQLKDLNLFKDLLEYILPAGITFTISHHSLKELQEESISIVDNPWDNSWNVYLKKSSETSFVPRYTDASGQDAVELSDRKGGRNDNTIVVPYEEDN